MPVGEIIVVAVAIFVAASTQVVAGFGFALLCMPIMTIALPVERAVVVSTLIGTLAVTWQAWHLRANLDRVLARRLSVAAFVGMPLGLFVLNVFSDRSLRLLLGVAVLIATALLARRINLAHAGPHLDYGAGFISGVLNTSLSTNGPPLVFALQARHLETDRFRATINMVFAASNVVTVALFALDGKFTSNGVVEAAFAVPAWVLGQMVGWPLRSRLHGDAFRRLVLALLFAAGSMSIVFSLT